MNRTYRIISIILLFFTLISAIYGGLNLILYPDGSSLQLSLDLLDHTAFKDYLIPGIILIFTNGIFTAYVLYLTFIWNDFYAYFIIAQGILLTGWIFIQILLIREVYFLHYIMAGIGICLIILGLLLKKSPQAK